MKNLRKNPWCEYQHLCGVLNIFPNDETAFEEMIEKLKALRKIVADHYAEKSIKPYFRIWNYDPLRKILYPKFKEKYYGNIH